MAALFAGVGLCVTGCLVVPISASGKQTLAGRRVDSDRVIRLEAGRTTRAQVIAELGPPDVIWEDRRVLAYDWHVKRGEIFWMIAGGNSATGGIIDIPQHQVLLMQFDEADVLQRLGQTIRRGGEEFGDHLLEWEERRGEFGPVSREARR